MFHSYSFKYNATRDQMPFRLAYACTIHKAQGQTILKCVIDLGKSLSFFLSLNSIKFDYFT